MITQELYFRDPKKGFTVAIPSETTDNSSLNFFSQAISNLVKASFYGKIIWC